MSTPPGSFRTERLGSEHDILADVEDEDDLARDVHGDELLRIQRMLSNDKDMHLMTEDVATTRKVPRSPLDRRASAVVIPEATVVDDDMDELFDDECETRCPDDTTDDLIAAAAEREADAEIATACNQIQEAMFMRQKYATVHHDREDSLIEEDGNVKYPFNPRSAVPKGDQCCFDFKHGVAHVWKSASDRDRNYPTMYKYVGIQEHYRDLRWMFNIGQKGPTTSFAFKRLRLLEARWNMHMQLNEDREIAEQKVSFQMLGRELGRELPKNANKKWSHRDFYNVRKVDTHIHHSASMNQKHLLRFIKKKLKKNPHDVVLQTPDGELTLEEVFENMGLGWHNLSLDTLNVHAVTDKKVFHRFDKFNLKYNPCGQSALRDIFLKTDNFIQGRYLAELTRELIDDLEESKYQNAEWRVSIYGRSLNEWDKLADWVCDNRLSSYNVRWYIQIPRLYNVYKNVGQVERYSELIENIFRPLFEVTQDPSSHPKLHHFLKMVAGFDTVDDESKPDKLLDWSTHVEPADWDTKDNPPFKYYLYYMWANLNVLNNYRKSRGFRTFELRPHTGEAGDVHHLDSAYLLCTNGISHGINLRKNPTMQYLYYLDQIGLALSPLSNNALFLNYHKSPFMTFFARGLNVSLSTDDPLMFHFTKEPLMEEYSVAAQTWHLNSADLCEIARNSVLQSGFEEEVKKYWIGPHFAQGGVGGNDIMRTNVPPTRMRYRSKLLEEERALVNGRVVLSSALSAYNTHFIGSPFRKGSIAAMKDRRRVTISPVTAGGLQPPMSPLALLNAEDAEAAERQHKQKLALGAAAASALFVLGVAVGRAYAQSNR